ncbi:UPF0231 family protein [Parashewanella curva]|uniref:UPF0231 family protein n=1 Tax=Parashewanella curva TaxID=2338552 RepID=A0A3L8PZ22_9GAMM|nr:YacL family protein [Parashewanella curva]RLV60545.1 UPF0231 family protein [Parashewanella curva]
MDFEFRHSTFDDSIHAFFSMEHHALGRWFTEELSQQPDTISKIELVIEELQSGKRHEWKLIGRTLSLELHRDQALIVDNSLGIDCEEDLQEDMNLYDSELTATCGLEDFEQALMSFKSFVKN